VDDAELDERLRYAVVAMVANAPPPRPFPHSPAVGHAHGLAEEGDQIVPNKSNRGRLLLVGVALALAVAGGWAAWRVAARPGPVDTVGAGLVVSHEVVAYEQSFDLTCPGGEVNVTGLFDTMVFESWASQDLGRWRQVVRYPDGSQRSLVATQSPWYPVELFTSGELQGQQIGCPPQNNLLNEPGQGSWFSLNPMAEIPNIPGSPEPAVQSYSDLGRLVDSNAVGPDGRPAELWQAVVDGTYGSESGGGTIRQVDEWLVDPVDDRVLRRSHSQDYEGLGEVRWTARLISSEPATVDYGFFTPDGLNQQEVQVVPGLTPNAPIPGERPSEPLGPAPTVPRRSPSETTSQSADG